MSFKQFYTNVNKIKADGKKAPKTKDNHSNCPCSWQRCDLHKKTET